MQLIEFEQEDNEKYRYLFALTREANPEFIIKFLNELGSELKDMRVSEKNKDEFISISEASEFKFQDVITVYGYSEYYKTNLLLFIHPFSPIIILYVDKNFLDNKKIEDDDGKQKPLSKREKKLYFVNFLNMFEIAVYENEAKEEAYNNLASSIRAYIDSDYNPEYAEFCLDNCQLDLYKLLMPPQKNRIPLS